MPLNEKYIAAKEKIAKMLKGTHHDQKENRVPPGQHLTPGFPVLDLGIKPDFNPKTWKLKVYGIVKEQEFTYDEILKMPSQNYTKDFTCVTSWTKLDVKWKGIPFKEFLKIINPSSDWKFIIQESLDGYTTNVPREDLERDDVFIAFELDGSPIPREHGWPIRIIIPHLYGWKGAKFLRALKFTKEDEPGFWEIRGYHNHGDIWKEERYG